MSHRSSSVIRKGYERYVAPHRRGKEESRQQTAPCTLDDLAHCPLQIQLIPDIEFSSADLETCPVNLRRTEESVRVELTMWRGSIPEERETLLRWFHDRFLESSTRLVFPSTMTREERSHWHRSAQDLHLSSVSKGFEKERHLTIAHRLSAVNIMSTLTSQQRAETERIWNLCQQEGGHAWEISMREIAEMLVRPEGLTPTIKTLVTQQSFQ